MRLAQSRNDAIVGVVGIHRLEPKLRDQVVARYKQLNLPVYWAGINPELIAKLDAKGDVSSVTMTYPRDAIRQYLMYGRMYRTR